MSSRLMGRVALLLASLEGAATGMNDGWISSLVMPVSYWRIESKKGNLDAQSGTNRGDASILKSSILIATTYLYHHN